MPSRLRPLLLALSLVALLALPGAALGAKTRTRVEPASTSGFVKVRGSNGWTIQITGDISPKWSDGHDIAVYANGPHHQTLGLQLFPGRFSEDGAIEARLPGIGHIRLRYEPTKFHTIQFDNGSGCTGARTTTGSSGVFRGVIDLRFKGAFTEVHARSGRGELWPSPKTICRVRPHSKPKVEREVDAQGGDEEDLLHAFAKTGGGTVNFQAWGIPVQLKGLPPRVVEFAAEYTRRERGMMITASTRMKVPPKDFTVAAPSGSPTEATVEGSAPFAGSAEFKLLSPTTASWTGDLRVPLPTLGTVDLSGPRFESTLCLGLTCTSTASDLRLATIVPLLGSD